MTVAVMQWPLPHCRPGRRWAATAGLRETPRSGRGTSAVPSESKASKWSRTTRTTPLTPIKCFSGQKSRRQGVRIEDGPPFGPFYCSRQLKKATASCDDLHKKKETCIQIPFLSLCFTHAELLSLCILTIILGRGEASVGFSCHSMIANEMKHKNQIMR